MQSAVATLDTKELVITELKNIVDIAIKVGKRPLQGTKLFVSIAISLSLGESIILQPITPAALHPNPIHIVKHCFPCAQAFLNRWSKLNATLGKYPKSSSRVNNGKNIAIGGSITEITHANVLYNPKTNISFNHDGQLILFNIPEILGSNPSNILDNKVDG